jgi:hypothetical protein
VVDSLSRSMKVIHLAAMSTCETYLKERVKSAQEVDEFFKTSKIHLDKDPIGMKYVGYQLTSDNLLTYKGRLYIPTCDTLKIFILDELYKRPYVDHPGYQKMITTLRKFFYWKRMKKDTIDYLDKCLECQWFKVEHQHPTRLLQSLPILEWKWETISMDFITGIPKMNKQNYAMMVVVDKLSKATHFISVKSTCKEINIANIFMKEIFKLHGMPKEILSNRYAKFTLAFWKSLFIGCGTQLLFSTTYHPQTDGKIERVNRILEYMLRMHVMHQPRKWEEYLPLVEFSYNNGYQESLKWALLRPSMAENAISNWLGKSSRHDYPWT